jgi:hypothetical protein
MVYLLLHHYHGNTTFLGAYESAEFRLKVRKAIGASIPDEELEDLDVEIEP